MSTMSSLYLSPSGDRSPAGAVTCAMSEPAARNGDQRKLRRTAAPNVQMITQPIVIARTESTRRPPNTLRLDGILP